MAEVEAAKRQLFEYFEYQQLTEQKLQEEREKANRAVVSLTVSFIYCLYILVVDSCAAGRVGLLGG